MAIFKGIIILCTLGYVVAIVMIILYCLGAWINQYFSHKFRKGKKNDGQKY